MNKIYVTHACLLSQDSKKCYVEANERYNLSLTFFWWKLDENENYLTWIKRELLEETWLKIPDEQIKTIIEEDRLNIWDITYIWRVYCVILTKIQIYALLKKSTRNIELNTDDASLDKANFAFNDLSDKIKLAIKKVNL